MKQKLLTSVFVITVLLAHAQLKVYSGGNTYVGGTTTTPNSVLSIGGSGNSAYETYILNPTVANYEMGLVVDASAPITSYHTYGILGRDSTATTSGGYAYGIFGQAYKFAVGSNGRHYGVYGQAANATSGYNYGVYGLIAGSNNGAGIYGTTSAADYIVPGKYAGFFNGDIRMTTDNATKTATNTWSVSSDKRLKKNIAPFTDGLNVIRKINPVTFQFSGIGGLPSTDTNIGVLAQDVQKVAPYCIGTKTMYMKQSDASANGFNIISTNADTSGTMALVNTLTMNTHGLFYAMLNSIKQLDSTVTSLQKQVNQCCNNDRPRTDTSNQTGSTQQIELANNADVILYQNQPNPFSGSTVIRYFVPENVSGEIYISFLDMYGSEIKRVDITNKGFGNISAGTENLVSGIYTYCIVVNGKVMDTKKMIKTQ